MELVKQILEVEEGWRSKPYYCSENYPTIGYGFKLADKGAPLPKFTLPKSAGDAWLNYLVQDLRYKLGHKLSGLNEARQAIILSMCYQLGVNGCLAFKNMWQAIENRDFQVAAIEMIDSRWARQTPERAQRHADVMSSGELLPFYTI